MLGLIACLALESWNSSDWLDNTVASWNDRIVLVVLWLIILLGLVLHLGALEIFAVLLTNLEFECCCLIGQVQAHLDTCKRLL